MMEVKGVFVERAHSRVLEDINISLLPGTITAIVGPNGAGKSTLLRVMAGILPPTQGEVTLSLGDGGLALYGPSFSQGLKSPLGIFKGRGKRLLSSLRGGHHRSHTYGSLYRYLSWYGDQSPVTFNYSVEDLVMMGRFPYHQGWPQEEDKERVSHALNEMGISSLRTRSAPSLSSGELQKTMLARTLAQDPKVLLLDEPASHLDHAAVFSLAKTLRGKSIQGTTIALVLHDLSLAMRLADELVMMDHGKVSAHVRDLKALESQEDSRREKEREVSEHLKRIFKVQVVWLQHGSRSVPWMDPKI